MIPKPLKDTIVFLKGNPVRLLVGGSNARQNSAQSEKNIVSHLMNSNLRDRYTINSPNIGQSQKIDTSWYDIKIASFYCDIKISDLKGTDNTGARRHIFYFLTGKEPPKTSHNIFKKMKPLESPSEKRDFYYLIINKYDPSDCFVVSLKGINNVRSNSRNQPFQCRWDSNRELQKRDWKEAKQYLLSNWAESIKKEIELAKRGMPIHYPEYF